MIAKIHTMRAWIRRRDETHKPWNSDELWNRIRSNWPSLTEDQHEEIFQRAAGH